MTYWTKIGQQIQYGIAGKETECFNKLIDAALEFQPGHPTLLQWKNSGRGQIDLHVTIEVDNIQQHPFILSVSHAKFHVFGEPIMELKGKIPTMQSFAELIDYCCKHLILQYGKIKNE